VTNLAFAVASFALAAQTLAADAPGPTAPVLPTIQGVSALAAVNGEPVSWHAFVDALGSVHAEAKAGTKRKKQDPQALLDRLITGKLIAQEARNIGLDKTPEFAASVKTFRQDTLAATLLEKPAATVTKNDPADVERIYRASVGLAKFDSLLFDKKPDAEAAVAKVGAGGDFAATARAAVAAGQSKSFDEGGGAKLSELQPEVVNALVALKPGQMSGVIAVQRGWIVVKLVELSIPDDPAARAKAEKDALDWKRLQAVKAYSTDLRRRYVKVDTKLLDGLDFDAEKPGLDAYAKDTRVVATVERASSVTVGDLAAEVERAFFHGTEKAAKEKKLNPKKYSALDELLVNRLTVAEGTRLGLDKTSQFKDKQREFEEGLLFTAFLKKVILPDVKVDEADIKAWYEAHKDDYSSPAMLRLDSIAFTARADAEDARKKAASGADFGWLKKNAAGRSPVTDDVVQLNGGVYIVDQVDPDMAKILGNPKEGDARLFAAPDGPIYVVLIREVIPTKTQAYAEVRSDAGQAVINERTKKLLDDWSTKLRKAYQVKTFVTPVQLDALVKKEFGPKA
jgi:parvulin-like peptidyl-prolyl isomerase